MVSLLSPEQATRLAASGLSYAEVGQTRGELPAGYQLVRREAVFGTGSACFHRAVDELLSWQLQRRAGVRVVPSAPRVADGVVANLLLGVRSLALKAPVKVVYVIDEPRRRGFGYGTLAGHPESGEESFIVEHRPDDTVAIVITAFSRPASLLARVGGPLASAVQRAVTSRYLRALSPRE
ncbi:MAG: hypothetical protein QOF52_3309 [Propionibacteriaceae bacterium]|jgi:uncharacterized protein (UPF0548 family)|nr:hypothetical protein [Propionibacteriaceae bacterium]MDX6323451.1 hypothetical protein [Propionibacteriaceae bacterium]